VNQHLMFDDNLRCTHVHGVLTGGDFASVALSKGPEERVGKSVLAEVGQDLVLDLESRELGCRMLDMASKLMRATYETARWPPLSTPPGW
jgi:hypothetical protein